VVDGKQLYKCLACGRQFRGGDRLEPALIWEEYLNGKQTYAQLAGRYGCSIKTIQRKVDAAAVKRVTDFSSVANVLMDTTYFGKKLGVMVFKDSITGQILYKQYVKQETNKLYLSGIEEIARRGIKIQAIICDGRKGLLQMFGGIPVQMCNFHQVAIIRRYLTKKPKMQASKELWELSLLLARTDKESFEGGLAAWHAKWVDFLNERKVDASGKKRFVHKKLRSAYRSLKTNLPWLFTWYDNMSLNIPNTTNAIDGHFADLKNKLRNHNGLSTERKKKLIDEFFKA
jgi:putative transposon-encoded protein